MEQKLRARVRLAADPATCLTPPIFSYVSEVIASTRIANFKSLKKHDALTNWIRQQETPGSTKTELEGVAYDRSAFLTLTDALFEYDQKSGVRVYFASYIKTGGSLDQYIPAGQEHCMTFIFAPTQFEAPYHNDIGDYYIIAPTAHSTTPQLVKLPAIVDIQNFPWVQHYEKKAVILEQLAAPRPAQETRSVWFLGDTFTYWEIEIKCWERRGRLIKEVLVALSAYEQGHTLDPIYGGLRVEHQLTLIVSIKPEEPGPIPPLASACYFPMETDKDFKAKLDGGDFDTSVPCPPAVCDGRYP